MYWITICCCRLLAPSPFGFANDVQLGYRHGCLSCLRRADFHALLPICRHRRRCRSQIAQTGLHLTAANRHSINDIIVFAAWPVLLLHLFCSCAGKISITLAGCRHRGCPENQYAWPTTELDYSWTGQTGLAITNRPGSL